jgi:hypothetical protein
VDQGWRRLASTPRNKEAIAASFTLSSFARLARTHGLLSAGDAMVAVALADSVFFSATADAARSKVALYLLLTVAPFSVISPLIGPFIDKMPGGRRLMVILTALARAIAAIAMVGNLDSLALYPLAFVHLVSIKAYGVAKTAIVPTVVRSNDELVEANAKLGLISGFAAFAGALPMLPITWLGWSSLIVVFAGLIFAAGAAMSYGLPRTSVVTDDAEAEERSELQSSAIVLAATSTAILRGIVGFMTFLVVFWFKRTGASTGWLAAAVTLSTIGSTAGNAFAPILRRSAREETILAGALSTVSVMALLVSVSGSRAAMCVLAAVVGTCATLGKLAFDAIVQRDAPGANQGRSLASFETKFQIAWVVAAFVPVLVPLNGSVGAAILAVAGAVGLVSYLIGRQHIKSHGSVPDFVATPLWWLWRRRPSRSGAGGSRRPSRQHAPQPTTRVIDVVEAPAARQGRSDRRSERTLDRTLVYEPLVDRTHDERDVSDARPRGSHAANRGSSPFDEPPAAATPVSEWPSEPSPSVGSVPPPPPRPVPRRTGNDPTLPLDWDDTV